MKRIAQFEKVSPERFELDWKNEDAKGVLGQIKIPRRATMGSAGYDFYAPCDFSLGAGESINIPTGIRVKIDEGWVLKIYPRSGLGFKFRIMLSNTVGIIDSDYYYSDNEGHIFIKIINDNKEGTAVSVRQGEAFAQGVFVEYGITYDDDARDIRNGGFGSTTK